jgi:hypothetical protein
MRRQVPHYRHLVLGEATLAAIKTTEQPTSRSGHKVASPIHNSSNPAPIETRPLTLVLSSSHSAAGLDNRSHKRQVAGSHSSPGIDNRTIISIITQLIIYNRKTYHLILLNGQAEALSHHSLMAQRRQGSSKEKTQSSDNLIITRNY